MAEILVADRSWPEGQLNTLEAAGHNITVWDAALDTMPDRTNELHDLVIGKDGILLSPFVRVNDALVDAAIGDDPNRPFAVGSMAAGYNHIDRRTAARSNVHIGYAAGETDTAVAELTTTLIAMTVRGVHRQMYAVQQGTYRINSAFEDLGRSPRGLNVGIIGLGRIGLRTAQELQRMYDCDVVHFSGSTEAKKYNDVREGIPGVPLEALLTRSDVVSVHTPLTEETRGMCDSAFFACMAPNNNRKNAGIFLNFARGDVVDQTALYQALELHQVADAALDVTTPDPLPPHHDLVRHPRTTVLPHIGSAVREIREAMSQAAVNNLLHFYETGKMITPLTIP